MKKLIALLLAVTVLFSLALTGCKSETPNTPNNTASDTPSTPDDTGDNEPAASGKDPDRLIKIGFVFSAIVSTDAWAQTSENARLYLEENCQNVETYKVENIAGGADCERVMRSLSVPPLTMWTTCCPWLRNIPMLPSSMAPATRRRRTCPSILPSSSRAAI